MREMRNLNREQLGRQLAMLREQARDLRFKIHSKEVKNPHQLRMIRKDIARILTVLKEK